MQCGDQFKAADHSDHLVSADHGELRNFAHVHLGNDIVDGGILVNAKGIWGHDRGDTKRTHALPNAPGFLDAQKYPEPVAGWIDAKFVAVQEISFGNDPHNSVFVIENGKPPLVCFQEQTRNVDERCTRRYGCERGSA